MGDIHLEDQSVLSSAELRARGLSQRQIEGLVRRGRLHRVEQGIFTTAPPRGKLLLRALGLRRPNLVFTGRTALELRQGTPLTLPVQAVVDGKKALHRSPLLQVRRRRHIRFQEIDGFKVTLRAVSVADADDTPDDELITFMESQYRGTEGRVALEAELGTMHRVPAHLTALLSRTSVGADSDAERLVFRALIARGVEVEQNVPVGGYLFDLLIRKAGVIVEIDGYRYHTGEDRKTFVRDRRKANVATRQGFRVLRYSGSCVTYHLEDVVEQIMAAVDLSAEELPTETRPVWEWHHTFTRDGPWLPTVAQ